jgi:hypothetical protein
VRLVERQRRAMEEGNIDWIRVSQSVRICCKEKMEQVFLFSSLKNKFIILP